MPTKINITGQIFGRLTAIEKDSVRKGYWRCNCSCGKESVVRLSHLRSGATKSCGCAYKDLLIDLTGKKFGRLTVKSKADNLGDNTAWNCECECGNVLVVRGCGIKSGNTLSCGCLHNEITAKIGHKNKTHGMRQTKTYRCWSHMIGRCKNITDKSFESYGGRGISVCERWHTFENFYADMGEVPDGLSIERNDVNGNYEPSNCRWATQKEQSRNTTRSRYFILNGEQKTLAELCEISGLKNETLRNRLDRDWDVEKAMNTPAHLYHNRPA